MVNHYQASFPVGFDRWLLGLWNQQCRSVHCFEPNSLATASLEFKWADPNLLGGNLTNSPDANNHRSSTTTNQNLYLKSQSSKLNYRLWNQKLHHYNTSLFTFFLQPLMQAETRVKSFKWFPISTGAPFHFSGHQEQICCTSRAIQPLIGWFFVGF